MSDAAEGAQIEFIAEHIPQNFYRFTGSRKDKSRICQLFAQVDSCGFIPGSEDTVVADFTKSRRQYVQHEPANKLLGSDGHGLDLVGVSVIPPAKSHAAVF